jgi:hypothetical protein
MATKKITEEELEEFRDELSPFYDSRRCYNEQRDVKSGAWVCVNRLVPVAEYARPEIYAIYWAVPVSSQNEKRGIGWDKYNRQAAKIMTTEEVVIFTDEYFVVSDKDFEMFKQEGWYMVENNRSIKVPLNIEIINDGRDLCEEEREIIWALQLDGLTEQQACEQYFFTKHIDANNSNVMWMPPKDKQQELLDMFGQ